ncbi:MAG: hypothetical protein NVSMB16_03690 [Acidimicrobiales bacterium]
MPSGVWIDEDGLVVRPPEPAFPGPPPFQSRPVPEDVPEYRKQVMAEAKNIRTEPERYVAALRDWVANGSESRFALSPDEVVARSRPRPKEAAEAAAHFELAQHLQLAGNEDAAVRQFQEAHRLPPENWTYKCKAWVLADPFQRPTGRYDGDWLSDVQRIGAENYYEPLEM